MRYGSHCRVEHPGSRAFKHRLTHIEEDSMTHSSWTRFVLGLALLLAPALIGCGGEESKPAAETAPATPPPAATPPGDAAKGAPAPGAPVAPGK